MPTLGGFHSRQLSIPYWAFPQALASPFLSNTLLGSYLPKSISGARAGSDNTTYNELWVHLKMTSQSQSWCETHTGSRAPCNTPYSIFSSPLISLLTIIHFNQRCFFFLKFCIYILHVQFNKHPPWQLTNPTYLFFIYHIKKKLKSSILVEKPQTMFGR